MSAIYYPIVACPVCKHKQRDYDGFGFIACDQCGFCTHPSEEMIDGKWECGICGRRRALPIVEAGAE